ncbi:MAG TPA: ABC transporter transmembrane domain-containing protein [Pseudomonadales bacterium]
MSTEVPSSERARGELGGLRPALRFLSPYKKQIAGAGVALVFTALVTLSIGQGLRLLIDRGFSSGSAEQLNVAILIFFLMVGLLAVGTFVRFYLVSWIGERVVADMRKAVFNHIIELHPGFFEENGSGEIQTRLTTDTTLLQTVIGSSVSIALRNFLMFIGGLVWMFFTDPKLTSIVLLSVPLVILPIVFFGRRVRALSRSSQDRVAEVGSYVGEALKNIKTVQAFNHQPHDRANFSSVVEEAFDVAIRRISQRSWLTVAVIVLVLGAVAVMLWVGGHDVLAGRLTGGELVAFIFYAVMVAGSVGAISEVYGDLQRAAGATERLMELLHAESLITTPANPEKLPGKAEGSLAIEGLRFWYPSRPDTAAIDGLDLQVAPGTRVALVGSSGAGKSTLFDLLLRFYNPQEGVIRLDGIDISRLDPSDLRRHIAIVPQQPTLFTGNVIENIRYGCPDATEAQVIAAAKAAHAHEFVERLPEGYQSFLGDGGVRLSGGQRQRIAIARAILLDPELLLLDEATSALDAESEFVVQQALEGLMKQRTSLVIAHRLATVVDVERIVVLDQGRIVATGTHQELLSRSPLYARWAELQFGEAALA